MSDQRWIKEPSTPGEDPREIDEEKTSPEALDELAGQDGIVHPQEPKFGTGTTSDAPGRDLDDLSDIDAPEVERNRHES